MTPIFSRIWLMNLAFELGLGHQGGDRVDHHHVDGVAAHQHLGDFQRLLAVVGLRDQEVIDVDAELSRVLGVERVLGVDEGADAAPLLGLADGRQRQGGLTRRLRAVDLDDAAAREAADADRVVDGDRAAGDRFDGHGLALTEAHDRSLAELAFDLGERAFDGLQTLRFDI
jgi:hypothetical protein